MNVSLPMQQPPLPLPLPTGAPIPVRRVGTLSLAAPDALGRMFISSASGMVGTGREAIVVSDELHEVARFTSLREPGTLEQVLRHERKDGSRAPVGTKVRKPDLEAVTLLTTAATADGAGRSFVIGFGSGSAKTRQRAFARELLPPGSEAADGRGTREIDLAPLYEHLRRDLPLGLNIEGAAVRAQDVLLLHRGGLGEGDRNIVFRLDRAGFERALLTGTPPDGQLVLGSTIVELGSLNDVPLGFSDARALPDGRVLFAASAEASVPAAELEPARPHRPLQSDPQPPVDGEVRGSALGVLDAELGLTSLFPLAGPRRKVEGVELVSSLPHLRASRSREPGLDVLLVTDPDDPAAGTEVLRTRIPMVDART